MQKPINFLLLIFFENQRISITVLSFWKIILSKGKSCFTYLNHIFVINVQRRCRSCNETTEFRILNNLSRFFFQTKPSSQNTLSLYPEEHSLMERKRNVKKKEREEFVLPKDKSYQT